MTHARIRAAQGDVEGARRVLAAILRERPDHAQARALLQVLGGRSGGRGTDDRAPAIEVPVAGDARRLARRFRRALGRASALPLRERILRLRRFLARVAPRGHVGGRHA